MFSGVMSLIASALPWLGFGKGYTFHIPLTDYVAPRLDLFYWQPTFPERLLYAVMEFPLHILGLFVPMGLVYFDDEGPVTVKPFTVFVFWFALGLFLVWASMQASRHQPTGPDTNQPTSAWTPKH